MKLDKVTCAGRSLETQSEEGVWVLEEEVFNRGLGVGLEGTRRELKSNACESESERRARR